MEKIECGMYVRTKEGVITKIEQIVDDEIHFNIKPIFSDGECLGYNWFYIKDVVKASNNIIDLIEVGDYVNGYKVEEVKRWEVELELVGCFGEEFYSETIPFNDIRSIVTKEQFESMSYKL